MGDCDTIRCIRHWCPCGAVINHCTMVCPRCGTNYSGEEVRIEERSEIFRDDDSDEFKQKPKRKTKAKLSPVMDEMEF